MPLNNRRELTPQENTQVSQAESRWKPTLFTSDADPVYQHNADRHSQLLETQIMASALANRFGR